MHRPGGIDVLQRRFRFDEIVAAHRFMEENRASGKLVVVDD